MPRGRPAGSKNKISKPAKKAAKAAKKETKQEISLPNTVDLKNDVAVIMQEDIPSITNDLEFSNASNSVTKIKSMITKIKEAWKPSILVAHESKKKAEETWRKLRSMEAEMTNQLELKLNNFKSIMSRYATEQKQKEVMERQKNRTRSHAKSTAITSPSPRSNQSW